MNDLQAQNSAVKAAGNSLTSSPQAEAPKKEKAKAETEIMVQVGGKEIPPKKEEPVITDEARSEEVKEAVSKLNAYVQKTQRDLDFQIDEESGKTVIKVYDSITAKLVRQIPDEAALELAKRLNSEEPSLLFSAQV